MLLDTPSKVKAGQVLHGQAISELRSVSEVWCHTIFLAAQISEHTPP